MEKIKAIIFDIGGVVVFKNSEIARNQKTNTVLIKFLEKIKRKYALYSLSNIDEEFHKETKRKGIYKVFKKNYPSYLTGIKKPSKKAFLIVLKENHLNPKEIIFVDDKQDNINTAKKLGMKIILFKNNKQLVSDLKKFGVEV